MSGKARSPYDPWRDVNCTHIPVGARVEQIAEAKEHGALRARVHQHGVVIRWGGRGAARLHVRFDGENQTVRIRPHLLRIVDS